jgi:hypothetical protein
VITDPTVDDLAGLCAALALDEVCEIMNEVKIDDLTACEIVALLTILRPVRVRLAQRQPAAVLKLVRSDTRDEAIDRLDPFG